MALGDLEALQLAVNTKDALNIPEFIWQAYYAASDIVRGF